MKRILNLIQLLIIVGAAALGITAMYQCGRDLWAVGLGIYIVVALGAGMLCCVISFMIKEREGRADGRRQPTLPKAAPKAPPPTAPEGGHMPKHEDGFDELNTSPTPSDAPPPQEDVDR